MIIGKSMRQIWSRGQFDIGYICLICQVTYPYSDGKQ